MKCGYIVALIPLQEKIETNEEIPGKIYRDKHSEMLCSYEQRGSDLSKLPEIRPACNRCS